MSKSWAVLEKTEARTQEILHQVERDGIIQHERLWKNIFISTHPERLFCVNLILARLISAQLPRTIKHFDSKCTLLSRCNSIRFYTHLLGNNICVFENLCFYAVHCITLRMNRCLKGREPKGLG